MTYLFTNPQVKRWKTLFFISFLFNCFLVVALYVEAGEEEQDRLSDPPADTIGVVAPQAESLPAKERSAGPVVGEPIPVWLTITENFYNAFTADKDIARHAEHFDFPRLAEILSVYVSRVLMWDLILHKDVMKGDTLSFVFRMVPAEEMKQREDMPDPVEILAVSYFSNRYNKFIDLFSYYAASKKRRNFYCADGRLLERVLKNPPIRDHVAVITLFDEYPPKHEGVDFKAPTGTPVYATFDGRITRADWQTRFNGYSLELTAKNGALVAKYLHLAERMADEGQEIKAGEIIAKSGSTGKAAVPHLHYQINAGIRGKALDPFKHHETYFEYLKGDELRKFQETVVDYKRILKKVVGG
ncbi:MAG TPA: M23 family metallopeptidase [bacterium]|nr:M23 family metallopeptidase [bacterium]